MDLAGKLKLDIYPTEKRIFMANNLIELLAGKTKLKIRFNNKIVNICVYILKNSVYLLILGFDFLSLVNYQLEYINIIDEKLIKQNNLNINNMINQGKINYNNVFHLKRQILTQTNKIKHSITLKNNINFINNS